VPSCTDVSEPKARFADVWELQRMLQRTAWRGLVIVDTKSDFEILTKNALAAADLALVVVKDHASLLQADKIFHQLEEWGRRAGAAHVLLSMVDRRIKYDDPRRPDVLAHLVGEIRRRGHPLLESFVSHSPKVASLEASLDGRIQPVLIGAPHSLVHRQLHHVAHDVLKLLDQTGLPSSAGTSS
jgi:cellulose biosynthesis protein BcsQ